MLLKIIKEFPSKLNKNFSNVHRNVIMSKDVTVTDWKPVVCMEMCNLNHANCFVQLENLLKFL